MTEDRPHIVYERSQLLGDVKMFPDYKSAHAFWKQQHSYQRPFLISTVGRVIDPSTPIVDVNE